MPIFDSIPPGALTAIQQQVSSNSPSSKNSGKTLVLHKSPGEFPEVTLRTTSKFTLFNKGLGAVKEAAVDHVKNALMGEYKLTPEEASKVLKSAKVGKDSITVGQLNKLNGKIKTHFPEKAFQNSSLNAQIDLPARDWMVSEKGSGGAIVIKSKEHPEANAVLKIEKHGNIQKALEGGKYADAMTEALGDKIGFDVAMFKKLDLHEVTQSALKAKLNEVKTEKGDPSGKLTSHLKDLESSKDVEVGQAEFVDGADLLDLLQSDPDAILLAESTAKGLGNLLALSATLQLDDHVSVTNHGNTNTENLMLSKATGKLMLIDTTPKDHNKLSSKTGLPILGEGDAKALQGTLALHDYLSKFATDPATALQKIYDPSSAVGNAVKAFTNSGYTGRPEDATKKQEATFVKNFLLGAVEGLELLKSKSGEVANVGQQHPQFMENPDNYALELNKLGDLSTAKAALNKMSWQDVAKMLPEKQEHNF